MNDLISRQAAVEAIVNTVSRIGLHDNSEVARYGATFRQHEIIDIVENLPSAEPERKRGRWVETEAAPHRIYCSECFKTYIPNKEWYAWKEDIVPKNFCPNCGVPMEVEDD